MAVRRTAVARGGRGGTRRGATDWARIVATGYTTVPAATKILLVSFALSNPGISETVRRTRGMISVRSDAAVLESQLGALGFVRVNDLAIAAGAASIPGPVTDASDDGWFVWEPFGQHLNGGGGMPVSVQYPFDSRAMRTVDEGFGLAVMIENAHPTEGLEVALSLSLLSSRT